MQRCRGKLTTKVESFRSTSSYLTEHEAFGLARQYESLLDNQLRNTCQELRVSLLLRMNDHVRELNRNIYTRLGVGHMPAAYPSWLYSSILRKSQRNGKDVHIQIGTNPDISPPSYLDHFGKVRTAEKWKYVSNPYRLSSEELEAMICETKEHGIRFDIFGESNYYPGKTFQIVFEEGGW